ncbi:hypothetical protein [Salinarimonas soli]|uniref:Alpha/beta hydrolase n=1 Tax=Salinarimonas soli TaxID=1638099 RepID=A0A5B2V8Y4_9HYPH|nr:hypothetical protein [Salinarimonas soli]KAA2235276.1 hypothetical protein F0L46_19860 [Salinarimonas soli]
MGIAEMAPGAGSFTFPDPAAGRRRSTRVFYQRPHREDPVTKVVLAMHGLDRAAAEFRDVLAARAQQHGTLVLVPEFDIEAFPDVHAYNYGNVRQGRDGAFRSREDWTFGIIDRLIAHVRANLGGERTSVGMLGNSAGSQFVLRYLALNEAAFVDRAIASNSGLYMLPDLALAYPDGMGGVGLDRAALARYFARSLTILLGEADCDGAATDLPRGPAASAQGPHRLARGLWHFDHCKRIAEYLGVPFAWKLRVMPGAGHVDQRIYDGAMDLLAET